jgi:hypothetical protein
MGGRYGLRRAVPACDEQIANVDVSLQIPDPLRVHPEHLLPLSLSHRRRRIVMGRTLEDELGGAPRRQAIVETDTLSDQRLLDSKIGIRFWNHPDRPSGTIRR